MLNYCQHCLRASYTFPVGRAFDHGDGKIYGNTSVQHRRWYYRSAFTTSPELRKRGFFALFSVVKSPFGPSSIHSAPFLLVPTLCRDDFWHKHEIFRLQMPGL